MKFVPAADTQVLVSVWDTRVQDFEAFVADTNYDATGSMWSVGKDGWKQRRATWRKPGFSQGPTHPVVEVNTVSIFTEFSQTWDFHSEAWSSLIGQYRRNSTVGSLMFKRCCNPSILE
jgi:hypothetical protein